ncbi:unnamed protein product, partial [Mesorhabditis spiculigera]
MQAAIALCHFCETHGPRVVVTCQTLRDFQLAPLLNSGLATPCEPSTSASDGPFVQTEDVSRVYGVWPTVLDDPEDRCDACTSLGQTSYLLSNDHSARTSYISSQVAVSEVVFDRIRTACHRSLSCEVAVAQGAPRQRSSLRGTHGPLRSETSIEHEVEEDDGNIVFGDPEHGYTLALTFRIPDAKARGLNRLYSLLVVSTDHTLLLNNHHFLLSALRTIAEKMKSLAKETYIQENDTMRRAEEMLRPDNATRVARIPHNMLSRKITLDTKRTLQVVTGDDKIWIRLHRHMMWTLRSQAIRMGDVILEGVPTQDMLIMMEMDDTEIEELDLDAPNSHDLTLLQLQNLKTIALLLSRDGSTADLDMLLKHIVTGGQVIAESTSRPLCRQFLLSLTNLLPLGCAKMCGWSDTHRQRFHYNLLGVPLGTDVPLEADGVMVIRLIAPDEDDHQHHDGQQLLMLDGVQLEIRRRPLYTQQIPTIVARFKQLLLDPEVAYTVLETTIRSTREQWVAKAKLCYQLQRQHAKIHIDQAVTIVKAKSHDKLVLVFWQAGLSRAFKDYVRDTIREQEQMKLKGQQQHEQQHVF